MQRSIIRLLAIFICGLTLAASAAAESIHIEWGYTPPSEPAVTGFVLYQEGTAVCLTQNPDATSMDCEVTLTEATTNFTLTATFSDGTESPHSQPFAFVDDGATPTDGTTGETATDGTTTDDSSTVTITGITGSKLFTFSWEQPTDISSIAGYRIYLNGTALCETNTPTDTTIACTANLLPETMTFSMSQLNTDGTESEQSNLLVFDPTTYPETYTFKLLDFSWEFTGEETAISGFRVFQNSLPICEAMDPTARTLACTVDIPTGSVLYGVKAVNLDGTLTELSNMLAYVPDASTPTEETVPLAAVFTGDPLTGTAPLTVNFDATASTGTISDYAWDFGDGSVGASSTASHNFTAAGTYTATLVITDSDGASSSATVAVQVTEPEVASTPPIAVVSSSGAAGSAPLSVSFDGSGSTATSPATITSYSWSFGDGTTAAGASVSHSFTAAGTYTTELTVTDSNGLTSATSTPVVVTAAPANVAPTAVISVNPTTGTAPLTVSFDGSSSEDSDGSIASYTWYFGDGSSGTGKTVTHTYTTEATFTATLQVTDDIGATGAASTTITVQAEEEEAELNLEIGEIGVTGDWSRVTFSNTFTNPIVIAGPASYNDVEPGVIRLHNIDSTGFEIKFAEWDYLDKTHPEEVVSFIVIEKGQYTLPDGSKLEAGTFAGSTKWATIPFSETFAQTPVVITTVASANESETISGRVKAVSTTGFSYYFREQEVNVNKHAAETINYIAWEPGQGTLGEMQYTIATTADAVQHAWYNLAFPSAQESAPLILADMQSTDGGDTSALRMQNLTAKGVDLRVEEEQSKDSEVSHTTETVGYIALNQKVETVLATFNWEFDSAEEVNISGFQIFINDNEECAIEDPSVRILSCDIVRPGVGSSIYIQAILKSGEQTLPSNMIKYNP